MRIVWSLLRIFYLVDATCIVTVLTMKLSPPPNDGDFVHQFIGYILVNICALVIGWAFLPWPKDEPAKKPAAAADPPSAVDRKAELETLDGQDEIQAFLDRRWKDRLAGIRPPEPPKKEKVKFLFNKHFENEWSSITDRGDFSTNCLVYAEVPQASVCFHLDAPQEVGFILKAYARSYGTHIGIRIDGVNHEGPRADISAAMGASGKYEDRDRLIVPLEMQLSKRLPAGAHVAVPVVRQAINPDVVAVVAASPEIPIKLTLGF